MTKIIPFPVKYKPPPQDVIGPITEAEALERITYERIRQERLARIRQSLEQINQLMQQLNKIKRREYDIFED